MSLNNLDNEHKKMNSMLKVTKETLDKKELDLRIREDEQKKKDLRELRKKQKEQKIKDEQDALQKDLEAQRLKEWEEKFDAEQKRKLEEEIRKEERIAQKERLNKLYEEEKEKSLQEELFSRLDNLSIDKTKKN